MILTLITLPRSGRAPTARQAYGEFGEGPRLALDLDRAAMLLRDDVVADRQAEPRPFAGWLGREKGLKQLGADLRLNARPVVAHSDLNRLTKFPRGDRKYRSVVGVRSVQMALPGGVEAVAKQVEEDTGNVLRHDLDQLGLRCKIALQRDVEVLILRAGAVICEV